MASKQAKDDFNYSQAATRLEEIVTELQASSLSVDDALKLYEEGMTLVRDTEAYLMHAEHVIAKLKVAK